ncbi:MAG: GNAT family N-acetyltransferase, partial [Microcystis aeruginosa]
MMKVDSCFISYLLSHPSDSEATGDNATITIEVRLA